MFSTTAFANACASSGTGNWNDSSKWTGCGGGVPGNGDTVSITSAHTVTIPAGYTAIIGDSGTAPSAIAAIACATYNGSGILNINGTLRMRGDVVTCWATWTFGPDAVLEHDSSLAASPSATHYAWTTGVGNWPDPAVTRIRGTSGHRAIIRNFAGSGTFGGFKAYGPNDQGSGQFDFEYVNIDGCGGTTPCAYMNSHNSSTASLARCDHCTVTNSGHMRANSNGGGTRGPLNVIRFTNSTFTSSTDPNKFVFLISTVQDTDVIVDTIYTDGVPYFIGSGNATGTHIRNVVVRNLANTYAMYLGGGFFRVAEFDRFLRITDQVGSASSGSFAYVPGGTITKMMSLVNSNLNPHNFILSSDGSGPDVLDGGWVEQIGTSDDGDAWSTPMGGAGQLVTLKNWIFPCNATTGLSVGSTLNTVSGARTFSAVNNTQCGANNSGSDSIGYSFEGEGFTTPAGLYASIKNNIVFRATSGTGYLVKPGPSGTAVAGTFAGVNYNWRWNIAAGPYSGATSIYTPNPPGPNDTTGDPQFVQQRHFLEWGQMLDPTITSWTDIVSRLAKMNDDTGYDSRFTISAAYDWLRAGYVPQNSAVMTAGDTGGRVGAMDGAGKPTAVGGLAKIGGRITVK